MKSSSRIKLAGILLLLIGTGPLTGCKQPNPNLLTTESLTVTGSLIQTQVGQHFEIVLPSLGANPSYKWVLKESENESLVKLSQEKRAASEYLNRTAPIDYAPNLIFVFEALTAGKTQLTFVQASIANPNQHSGIERSVILHITKNDSQDNPTS